MKYTDKGTERWERQQREREKQLAVVAAEEVAYMMQSLAAAAKAMSESMEKTIASMKKATKQREGGPVVRDIRFKAKAINTRLWAYGYYKMKLGHHFITDCSNVEVEVDPGTVCEYAGLCDAHRAPIFEWDRLRDPVTGTRGTVIFNDGAFCVNEDGDDHANDLYTWLEEKPCAIITWSFYDEQPEIVDEGCGMQGQIAGQQPPAEPGKPFTMNIQREEYESV